MKRFIFKTLLLCGITLALLAGIIFLIPIQPNDYFQAYNLKCKLLEETKSPRIIFVGGSNLAFGLDCGQIKDSLGVNVVNYGLHAGLGLRFMIDDVATYVRKGDILVIAPEYELFYTPDGESATIAPIQSVCRWSKLHLLNFAQIKNVALGLPRNIMYTLPKPHSERRYVLSGFNEFGDEIKHWQLESIAISKPGAIKGEIDQSFVKYFAEKVESFKKEAGCTVLIVPPACRKTAFEAKKKNVEDICTSLNQQGISLQVSPETHSFPDEYAYDTNYHLNYEGVQKYTSSMVDILKPFIKELKAL